MHTIFVPRTLLNLTWLHVPYNPGTLCKCLGVIIIHDLSSIDTCCDVGLLGIHFRVINLHDFHMLAIVHASCNDALHGLRHVPVVTCWCCLPVCLS